MNRDLLIERVVAEVRAKLDGEGSGHDWWHVNRVWTMARRIGEAEGADLLTVELAALLHDIADWKFHDGDEDIGPRAARTILERHRVAEGTIDAVCRIIAEISFKGAGVATRPASLEGRVVQDADRLDAIGAIGIGRAFAYGGYKGRVMHDPQIPPVLHATKQAYAGNRSPTINHFYEKLLLLKDLMNTPEAARIAAERHKVMEEFIRQFLDEWSGVR